MSTDSWKLTPELTSKLVGALLLVFGWAWYASSLPTQKQVKVQITESMKSCATKTEVAVLRTRVEITDQQNKKTTAEIKRSLRNIQTSLRSLADRLPRRPHK